jgi:hypothetical protein
VTFRLCVVHCLPSAIRLEDCIAGDTFGCCPKAMLSAIDATQTRIGLVACVTRVNIHLTVVPNDFTREARVLGPPTAGYCLTAIAEISIFAPPIKPATWTVARAGFGSGMSFL